MRYQDQSSLHENSSLLAIYRPTPSACDFEFVLTKLYPEDLQTGNSKHGARDSPSWPYGRYQNLSEDSRLFLLRRDVVEFCKICHACQMVGKPNQTIPKARLQPIPAVQEPFDRIIVDCVGPLPKTRSGNQYLLTMCASTRFPEAIPLRNIQAKTIGKALTKFFTLVGLPSSIRPVRPGIQLCVWSI